MSTTVHVHQWQEVKGTQGHEISCLECPETRRLHYGLYVKCDKCGGVVKFDHDHHSDVPPNQNYMGPLGVYKCQTKGCSREMLLSLE